MKGQLRLPHCWVYASTLAPDGRRVDLAAPTTRQLAALKQRVGLRGRLLVARPSPLTRALAEFAFQLGRSASVR